MNTKFLMLCAILLSACSATEPPDITSTKKIARPELSSIEKIELAHAKFEFLAREVVQFDIVLEFGGTERLKGTMSLATSSSAGKIAYKNGKELYFNHDKVFVDSTTENTSGARFAAYTWSYFFLFPYKLSDPGTNWSASLLDSLNGKLYNSQKLTFGKGVGDAPDDWYITYSNPQTNLLEAAAYIVTAGGTSVEEAEKDPHAISYHDYKKVDGIDLANSWKFWEWRVDSGLTRQLGEANLSNFKFLEKEEAGFEVP